MQITNPPSQGNLDPILKRQVVAREKSQRRSRPPRIGKLAFLAFCCLFLLFVVYLVTTS